MKKRFVGFALSAIATAANAGVKVDLSPDDFNNIEEVKPILGEYDNRAELRRHFDLYRKAIMASGKVVDVDALLAQYTGDQTDIDPSAGCYANCYIDCHNSRGWR